MLRGLKSAASFSWDRGGMVLTWLKKRENKMIAATATLLTAAYCALSLKEEYGWLADNFVLDDLVQKKMSGVSGFFAGLRQLKLLLDAAPDFVAQLPAAQKVIEFFDVTIKNDDELSQLLDVLESDEFKKNELLFTNQGKVLLAFDLMYNVKDRLVPLMIALGELDAYRSIAHLYTEHLSKRVTYCFAKYKKDTAPSIKMDQFWNPFVDAAKVIANDLLLYGPDARNMVITGPNAGGKSTLIKAIALNLLLAQSLGIAAADFMEFTPFYSIATYLNVVDDIAAGNSLFKAQVLRAQQIIELVEKTPAGQFSFSALDEMFNGTSSKESKVAAFSVAKHISRFDSSVAVFATHFPLLTTLADQEKAFANYKVSVEVDPTRGIHYPFKLEKGISHQHIALEILRQEGYAGTIIDEALSLMRPAAPAA